MVKRIFFALCLLMITSHGVLAGENRALVIGIDQYQDPGILFPATAGKDAAVLGDYLERHLDFRVTRLLGASATREAILKSLETMARAAKPGDGLLIYFSGAGETENLYGYGWWLGADARKGETETYVEVSAIQQALRQTQARRLLVISDAPFPDSACGPQVSPSEHKVLPGSQEEAYGHTILRRNRVVNSEGGGKNGVLVSALLEALPRLEGRIEGYKLFTYAQASAKASGENLDYRALRTGRRGGYDVVFLREPASLPLVTPTAAAPPVQEVLSASLEIRSRTEGAKLRVNGQDRGFLPVRMGALEAGLYRLDITAPGHEDLREELRLGPGEERQLIVTLNPEKPREGRLSILTSPEHATIRFENRALTYSPDMSLGPGLYPLRITAPLYEESRVNLRIEAGKKEETHIRLSLVPRHENSLGMDFVRIEEGHFLMGSPGGEVRRNSDEEQHPVTLSKPFFMQTHEVTVGQWRQFILATGYKTQAEQGGGAYGFESGFRWVRDPDYDWRNPGYPLKDTLPVSAVSYHDAQAFIQWLREKEGLPYDLPTEAQWEYAARAGSGSAYAYGACLTDSQANFAANSFRPGCAVGQFRKEPLAVGSLAPNAWGLWDIHGNMWEWCRDWYGKYPEGGDSRKDPVGPPTGQKRVVRGGGWDTDMDSSRVANRYSMDPSLAYTHIGFRLVIQP